jgi:hypothetical protein
LLERSQHCFLAPLSIFHDIRTTLTLCKALRAARYEQPAPLLFYVRQCLSQIVWHDIVVNEDLFQLC